MVEIMRSALDELSSYELTSFSFDFVPHESIDRSAVEAAIDEALEERPLESDEVLDRNEIQHVSRIPLGRNGSMMQVFVHYREDFMPPADAGESVQSWRIREEEPRSDYDQVVFLAALSPELKSQIWTLLNCALELIDSSCPSEEVIQVNLSVDANDSDSDSHASWSYDPGVFAQQTFKAKKGVEIKLSFWFNSGNK